MRRVLYIAGPYAGATTEEIRRNVARALALGRLASDEGYAPIVPHAAGWLGVFGAPLEDDDGQCREAAIEVGCAMARSCGCWVIARDDGAWSDGTRAETSGAGVAIDRAGTWAEWCRAHPDLEAIEAEMIARLAGAASPAPPDGSGSIYRDRLERLERLADEWRGVRDAALSEPRSGAEYFVRSVNAAACGMLEHCERELRRALKGAR